MTRNLLLSVVLLSGLAFGQGSRYDNFTWTANPLTPGQSAAILTIPRAAIRVCQYPANATPCTNYAGIYSDITLSTSITQPGFASDDYGNFGFYAAPGNYQYTVTYNGVSSGPYTISLGLGSPLNLTNNGVFTNTQMNEYLTSLLNGINLTTEYNATQGGNFSTDAMAGGATIPNTSTVWQVNGVAGYVKQTGSFGSGVGIYGQCRTSNTTMGTCQGGNFLAQIEPTVSSFAHAVYGVELDVNNNSGTDVSSGSSVSMDAAAFICGGTNKCFRGFSVSGTNPPNNAWRYGGDIHHFTEYGLKIGDAQAGGAGISLYLTGNAHNTFLARMDGVDTNFVKIVPTSDTDLPVWYVSNAADNAARATIYKAGFQGDYFRSSTSTPATTGQIRLANTDAVSWRNNGNTANLSIGVDTSDRLVYTGANGALLGGKIQSTTGLQAGTLGSVIADTRELIQSSHACGSTTTCANTANQSAREIWGTITLSGGAATLTGITAYTSTSSFVCMCTDQTAAAACKAVPASTTSVTFAGTGTDVLAYRCVGN